MPRPSPHRARLRVGPHLITWTLLLFAATASADATPVGAENQRISETTPVPLVPDLGRDTGFLGRQEARPFAHVGFFTERRELLLGLRTRMFDLEGGAALRLFDRLRLIGGYRMLDYQVSGDAGDVTAQHAGPFIGLSVRF